ncbi:family S53 protease-like protein [Beauveria brongniartii RCEF 3172]|uniref:Family S53 protease-like protein n=1 Tax=Beauveria brongniartii RCEF 3172 TaxID=1081107 RepID=A0A168DH23_9HYPO|nr:family S53 protease-like protein [Beauveria brongniartii RCEF 3172]
MAAFSNICFAAIAAIAASGVLAAPTPGPLTKFAELKRVPAQWATEGRASSETMIKARIGVKQNNIEGLQQKLLDIAHPNSANYGKWLSKEEVDKYTAPADSDVAAVKAWLASAGVNNVAHDNDWLEFTAPVSKMESLLDAKYEWFTHASTGLRLPRTKQFSVPENLHSVIDVITPTTALYHNMGPEKSNKGAHSKRQTDTDLTTPAYIRSAYNVDYNSKGSQTIATSAFQSVGASHSDFAAFAQQYQPGLADFTDISVNGATNDGQAGEEPEGNLDTQYAGAMASPNPSQFLSCGPANPFEDGLLAFSQYLNSASSPPSTVSTSYGDEENNFDTSYLDRICNEFMKAGSRGVSVFFSSGDSGVGGNRESTCPNGFYAVFPASCPYITSIGGTEFDSGAEVVANFAQYTNGAITSPGGGYSNYFAAPSYNAKVTAAYAQSLPSSIQSQFNASGRGYPDLSLISVQFQTEVNGQVGTVLGTSASSPSTAGLFSVLNDYLNSQGKPVLGFLNPLLYSGKINSAINDITSGSNAGCDSNGFPAQQGWDAASGLGSFNFATLRSLV